MQQLSTIWLTIVTCLVSCVDRELYKAIDYLREQVEVVIEQQETGKRILLDNHIAQFWLKIS